ncbi:MAG: ABC transporter ATP-binding protein [candidate division WOR-3 bacterium]
MKVIEVLNLYKSFKIFFSKKEVLKDISFFLNKGEIFGFLGPNGAGKTTTIKILIGLLNPDKGRVEILNSNPKDEKIKNKIGFLPEMPYFYEHLTGEEFLDYTARLYGIKNKKERIEYLLKEVGLYNEREKSLRNYSRGMLQRIGIANALISDPEILILDEPLSGLDPVGRKEMKDLIYKQKKEGKTVFFSSHILSDVEEICDRIAVIIEGRIIKIGYLSEILEEKLRPIEIIFENKENLNLPFNLIYDEKRGNERRVYVEEENYENLLNFLISNKIKIFSIKRVVYSLEEWFFEIYKRK